MDINLKTFYRERDDIMNQPDEDLGEYRKRIATGNRSHFTEEDSIMGCAPFPEDNSGPTAADTTRFHHGMQISSEGQDASPKSLHSTSGTVGDVSDSHLQQRATPLR